jgi:hypothetical protein
MGLESPPLAIGALKKLREKRVFKDFGSKGFVTGISEDLRYPKNGFGVWTEDFPNRP